MSAPHTPAAVLFDFSGTLFRLEEQPEWFEGLRDDAGAPLDAEMQAELLRRMTQPVGLPVAVDETAATNWARRDLDPEAHRAAYLAVLAASGLGDPDHAQSLYGRVSDPASWLPYPDTAPVLTGLAAAGTAVGVVSNIAFDLRTVFDRYGLTDTVGAFALSYEVGAIKPDVALFAAALSDLGVDPADALMVGDSAEADGGAKALGCAFELVTPLPTVDRPHALIDAVARHGIDIDLAS